MGAQVIEVTGADFRGVLEVNVLGVFHLVGAVVPHLAAASHTSVAIVGLGLGVRCSPGMLAYNASKGAFVSFRRALSVELFDRHRIGVNGVCPSIVDTPVSRRGMEVESFEGVDYPVPSADDVAWSVIYLSSANSRVCDRRQTAVGFRIHGAVVVPCLSLNPRMPCVVVNAVVCGVAFWRNRST
jgi:dihydroanticapsin dehydrogenase